MLTFEHSTLRFPERTLCCCSSHFNVTWHAFSGFQDHTAYNRSTTTDTLSCQCCLWQEGYFWWKAVSLFLFSAKKECDTDLNSLPLSTLLPRAICVSFGPERETALCEPSIPFRSGLLWSLSDMSLTGWVLPLLHCSSAFSSNTLSRPLLV